MKQFPIPSASPVIRAGMLLAFVMAQAITLCAQEPKVSVVIEPAEIRPGGFANFTVTIEGGQPDAATELKLPKAVTVANPSASFGNQTSIINGVITQSAMMSWQISSSEVGEHIISPQDISVGGKILKTNQTKLVVKDNPNSATAAMDPLLTIEVSKTQVYIGEVVPVTVNLYVHRRTNLHRIGLIEMPKDSFAIQRFPMQADESQVTMGGVPYRTLSFHSTLSALKPGKFKLGPATMEIILEMPMADERFQHPFFNQFEPRKMKPACNEIELTVLPLPTEGRPANFSGVVGDFELNMTADPKEVMLGDPISIELSVHGTGNFDALTPPSLTQAEDWKQYPARRLRTEPYNGTTAMALERTANFQQVIMLKKQVTSIPPFEFNFFSPSQKKYLTIKTDPVPVKVKAPERPVEAAPSTASALTGATTTGASEEPEKVQPPKVKMTDILTTTPTSATLLIAKPSLMKDRNFLVANVVLGGLFILMIVGRIAKAAVGKYLAALHTPSRQIWKQLSDPTLSRARFYELAASYIAATALTTSKAQAILEHHHVLNYGRPDKDSADPIKPEERANVLAALRETAQA